MKRLFVALLIVCMAAMLSGFSKDQKLSAQQQKDVVIDSMKYVLENTHLSGYTNQTVLNIDKDNLKYQGFNSVQKTSRNGIQFMMWPFKVNGSGIVLLSSMAKMLGEHKKAVTVSYKMYAYFDETNELKFETEDIKVLSNENIGSQQQTPGPTAPAPRSVSAPGPQAKYTENTASKKSTDEARKLFRQTYKQILLTPQGLTSIKNNRDWIAKQIKLSKGVENTLRIEAQADSVLALLFNKKHRSGLCNERMRALAPEKLVTGGNDWAMSRALTDEEIAKGISFCYIWTFEPFSRDVVLTLLLPSQFQSDFKISLQNAEMR